MAEMQSYIWLNEAASSYPKAPGVAEALATAMGLFPACTERAATGSADPVRAILGPVVEESRTRLAAMLGVDSPLQVTLTSSATYALNMAIWGIGMRLPRKAQIISSVCEHNAVLRPLRHLQRLRPDLRLTFIKVTPDGFDGDAYNHALHHGAGLVALIHVSNVTGRVFDVAPLFAEAQRVGAVTLLDASQAVGHLPVRADELHADLVAFPSHKGLRGPLGVGVLYVKPGTAIEPLLVGGTGALSELPFQPDAMPLHLEAGTPNLPAIAGFAAALRWREAVGEDFHATEVQRADALRTGLRTIPGVTIYDDCPGATYSSVVAFHLPKYGVEETGALLVNRYGVICRAGLHCAPLLHDALGCAREGSVRLSCSGATTAEDIDTALRAVAALAGERQ